MMTNGLLLVKVILFIFSMTKISCNERESAMKRLEPGKTVYNEVLFDNQVALFQLTKLQANVTYEIRISYPAAVPTDFTIRVLPPNDESSFRSRHLLNIEKTVFTTGKATEGYVAEVIAHRTGFPYDSQRLRDPIIYNIVVDTLHFGLTIGSWKMVTYAVIICIVSFKYLVPMVHRFIMLKASKGGHQS